MRPVLRASPALQRALRALLSRHVPTAQRRVLQARRVLQTLRALSTQRVLQAQLRALQALQLAGLREEQTESALQALRALSALLRALRTLRALLALRRASRKPPASWALPALQASRQARLVLLALPARHRALPALLRKGALASVPECVAAVDGLVGAAATGPAASRGAGQLGPRAANVNRSDIIMKDSCAPRWPTHPRRTYTVFV